MIIAILFIAFVAFMFFVIGAVYGYRKRAVEDALLQQTTLANQDLCNRYVEDPFITYSDGNPKGQCAHCGAKWYEHRLEALPESERKSAREIQEKTGILAKYL